jgi:hypothetical protein
LNIIYQSLVAKIANGTKIKVSATEAFKVSGEGSYDPDFSTDGALDEDLSFSWSCHYESAGIKDVCRDANTQSELTFPKTKDVEIQKGVLLSAPFAYVFELKLMKTGRSPSTKQISITAFKHKVVFDCLLFSGFGLFDSLGLHASQKGD